MSYVALPPVDGAVALVELLGDPETFLEQHLVRSFDVGLTGTDLMWFGDDGVNFGGAKSFIFAQNLRLFEYQHGRGNYGVGTDLIANPVPVMGPTMVQVHGVQMIDVPPQDYGALPPVPIELGSNFICTVPISGCCLVIQPYIPELDQGPFMVHIQPPLPRGRQDAVDMQRELQRVAAFAGIDREIYGAPICIGRESVPSPFMASVIGIRVDYVWRMWVQIYDYSARTVEGLEPVAIDPRPARVLAND